MAVIELRYFAWRGQVYEAELLHTVKKDDERWYAVVRPSPAQQHWEIGKEYGSEIVAIPLNVVRDTRVSAQGDLAIAALRKAAG